MSKYVNSNLKRRLLPEERRAQLLCVATTIFAQQGIGRVGHGDIAKTAGVSTGTVFNYFPTIEALNSAVLDEVRDSCKHVLIDGEDDLESKEPELVRIARKMLFNIHNTPNIPKIFLSWSNCFVEPYRQEFLDLKQTLTSQVASRLPASETRDIDSQIVFGIGLLYIQANFEDRPQEELQRLIARVVQILG